MKDFIHINGAIFNKKDIISIRGYDDYNNNRPYMITINYRHDYLGDGVSVHTMAFASSEQRDSEALRIINYVDFLCINNVRYLSNGREGIYDALIVNKTFIRSIEIENKKIVYSLDAAAFPEHDMPLITFHDSHKETNDAFERIMITLLKK